MNIRARLGTDFLAKVREVRLPHPKAHLSSQTSGENESSPEITEAVDEIGSGKAPGSAKGHPRQPGKEDSRDRRNQIGQPQATTSSGGKDPPQAQQEV